ncbi:hypothetical protein BV898_15781 [Hypsibius exemplaris]|uniref:Myb/SANT-like DNA-binding domain-containing protein n=1 Tax=Hypsibius exemplaris TaxID=2072580 RepID=A0A9X6RKW3_HYPEX|nr:hypothetical protein BV898_15781 [Hypsibius exemplaris]
MAKSEAFTVEQSRFIIGLRLSMNVEFSNPQANSKHWAYILEELQKRFPGELVAERTAQQVSKRFQNLNHRFAHEKLKYAEEGASSWVYFDIFEQFSQENADTTMAGQHDHLLNLQQQLALEEEEPRSTPTPVFSERASPDSQQVSNAGAGTSPGTGRIKRVVDQAFTEQQTKYIITRRLAMRDKFVGPKPNGHLWQSILTDMYMEFPTMLPKTRDQIIKRFHNMHGVYRQEKKKARETGIASDWKYFDSFNYPPELDRRSVASICGHPPPDERRIRQAKQVAERARNNELSLKEKVALLSELDQAATMPLDLAMSQRAIAAKYGIGNSTLTKHKQNKDKILEAAAEAEAGTDLAGGHYFEVEEGTTYYAEDEQMEEAEEEFLNNDIAKQEDICYQDEMDDGADGMPVFSVDDRSPNDRLTTYLEKMRASAQAKADRMEVIITARNERETARKEQEEREARRHREKMEMGAKILQQMAELTAALNSFRDNTF